MKLSNKAIKEIAEFLDCGLICYVHKETKEIKSIIDLDNFYSDEELWKEDIELIENNRSKYLRIDKMSSKDAFQVMKDFIDQVTDKKIRSRLIYALNRNKPFQNFKYEIGYDEEVRQQWFKFKAYSYEEWVKTYLENVIDEDENESPPTNIMGYYNDDGSKYNPDLYPLPNLCMSCKKKDDPSEEIVCNMTRMDQLGETDFRCFAYVQKEK